MAYKIIDLVLYNSNWPVLYDEIASALQEILGSSCSEIHHIGSTSVTGLCAKNTIDILLICSDLRHSLKLLEHGYVFKGELNIPLRFFFSHNSGKVKVNLHVCMPAHDFIELNLHVRDVLRGNEILRRTYAELKASLIKDPEISQRQQGVFTKYALRKNAFIKSLIKDSDYAGEYIVFCLHDEEWKAFESVSGEVVLDKSNNLNSSSAIRYLCFYQGAEIMACAKLNIADITSLEFFSSHADLCNDIDSFRRKIIIWQQSINNVDAL